MPGACAAKAQSPYAVQELKTQRGPQGAIPLRASLGACGAFREPERRVAKGVKWMMDSL